MDNFDATVMIGTAWPYRSNGSCNNILSTEYPNSTFQ